MTRAWWMLGWLMALLLAVVCRTAPAGQVPLEKAARIRTHSPPQTGAGAPARLSGVVTYAEPEAGICFVQDDTAGVMLKGAREALRKLKPGTRVEVAGRTARGVFAAALLVTNEASVAVLGPEPLPSPRRLAMEELQRGVHDGQWIEMRGVVRLASVRPFFEAAGGEGKLEPYYRLLLEINTAQGRYTAIVPWEAGRGPPGGLTDSAVRIEGVLGSIVNARGQWVGLLVYVPGLENVEVERRVASDPFQVPRRNVRDLLTFSAEKPAEERVRVCGTLLVDNPDYYGFLRTAEGTIELHGSFSNGLKRGDTVEASGYPTLLNKRVFLDDSLARLLSNGPPIEAIRATVSRCFEEDLHGELVELRGELLQNTRRLEDVLLILNCDGQSVEATLPKARLGEEAARIDRLAPGSQLQLEGVAQIATSMQANGTVRPEGFRLLLDSPAHIRLIRAPAWWTPERLVGLVGALLAVLGLVAVWVVMLRRQVRRQTGIIKERIEREAVWRDRSRIAQDIHDDLGASLTQVGFLSQRIKSALPASGEPALLAERIAGLSRLTVRALDEIVWAVNPSHDSLQSLADYLVKLAGEQLSLARIGCLLEIPPVLPEVGLRADVRHNLALAVKEGLHNVTKHSRARTCSLALHFEGDRLDITIQDDGIGFDQADPNTRRNGLVHIARRLEEIGGECRLDAAQGRGTRLRLSARVSAAKAKSVA